MQLVEFYRLNVKADNQIISVRHEIELLEKYMNIMMYRYPQLKFSYEIEEGIAGVDIPNFLLQPLVENSLLHGLKDVKYKGMIRVEIKWAQGETQKIIIRVTDNGIGMSKEQREKLNENLTKITQNTEEKVMDRIGIENIQKRLRVYYQGKGGIVYENNKNGGTTVVVTIFAKID